MDFDIEAVLDEILQATRSGSLARALALTQWLMRRDVPLPESAGFLFCQLLHRLIPLIPRPKVMDAAMHCTALIEELIAIARRSGDTGSMFFLRDVEFRWCEARGDFGRARTVLTRLMSEAEAAGDARERAVFLNNYAYEYVLEDRCAEALPHFGEALRMFEEQGDQRKAANTRANILECRFALLPPADWPPLLPALWEVHTLLQESGSWRERKTTRMLARYAAARGRLTAAVAWARQAEASSRQHESQLQEDDAELLQDLVRERAQCWSIARQSAAAGKGTG